MDIVRQFLTESLLLSTGDGALGIGFGFALSQIIATTAEWKMIVTTHVVMKAFGLSMAGGVLFGIYAAMNASRINPIEALRYELRAGHSPRSAVVGSTFMACRAGR